jgi:quercetin dioxygenase-like cupin family protein
MEKKVIKVGAIEISFLLDSTDTDGKVAMFEFLVPAGAKVPLPHYHEAFDEVVYGLEGTMTFTVGEKTIDISPGQSYFIPRGINHGFNNLQQIDAKALAVITPALLGPDYFIEIGEIINAGGPPDLEKLKVVFKKHGLVPVISK